MVDAQWSLGARKLTSVGGDLNPAPVLPHDPRWASAAPASSGRTHGPRKSIVDWLNRPTNLMSAAARLSFQHANMGLHEADDPPFAYDPTAGPMSAYFASIPSAIAAAVPEGTVKRDTLSWKRWTVFCRLVRTQTWRLDWNAHSGAGAAGFDRESRLLCAFLGTTWGHPPQARQKPFEIDPV